MVIYSKKKGKKTQYLIGSVPVFATSRLEAERLYRQNWYKYYGKMKPRKAKKEFR